MNYGASPSSPDYQHHHTNECIAGDTTVGGQKRVPDCDPAPRSGSQPMCGANMRWIIGAGSLLVAGVAFYVLMNVGSAGELPNGPVRPGPALDEIDAESRAAMRELLRDAGEE
jgi:hypothetical protein